MSKWDDRAVILKPVYRLESQQGEGPFSGDQVCTPFLVPHIDPENLFKLMGYPKEVLGVLSLAGFVFGWTTQRQFKDFFKPAGEKACKELGFKRQVYRPVHKLTLPDGQVMFAREDLKLAESPVFAKLLKGLSSKVWLENLKDNEVGVRVLQKRKRP